MKGAITEPSVRISNAPNNIRKITIGANQYFFRTLRNSQNSSIIEIFFIVALLFLKHLLVALLDVDLLFPFNPIRFPLLIKSFSKEIFAQNSHYNAYRRNNKVIHQ